ncbi:MAG: T9SS type A sorting domain-containing protein [Bacteroidales bacterium]|nr:T9SS type A sorting domain-containing protein [Bacteroidales bacterium]
MMKILLLSIAGLLFLTASSQTNLVLHFDQNVGENPLVLNEEYTHPEEGYNFSITRLQYYISEIEITHDGGQITAIEDTWLLVDAAEQSDFELGSYNISNVEGISFWIGVDEPHNHLDPTKYPEGHPLAPQNPEMHWGWAAGYRFACLEGKTGMNLLLTYQLHGLGDGNYRQVNLETGAMAVGGNLVIPILADYFGMYTDIDITGGLIEHGETGAAALFLQNFSKYVYSAYYFTGVEESNFEGNMAIGPNPATNGLSKAFLSLPLGNNYTISVVDVTGRLIQSENIHGGNYSFNLSPGNAGLYFVNLLQNGILVATEKLVVTQ